DLAEKRDCDGAVPAAIAAFGRLDALCNIAGVVSFANTPEMPEADYRRVIAVNLSAPFFLSQAAIPHLLATEGAIVNVVSTAAFVGEAYLAAYCASKAGLVQMTKAMAMEFVHKPIRINAVAPGGMATGIAHDMKIPSGADIALIKRYSGLRGLVEVEDAASVVAHLASPAGRGFHGACVTIDRGITAG
ncbi:MAG: SDR family oxidoreductase, partial [Parvularculaceae bacterium]|nr:SDR family oxidoreductase [Parvularculaceae bacterium]